MNGTTNSSYGKKIKKPDRRPLLVLVNPTSGTKLAKTMLKTILEPELHSKDIQYELISSQYAGHVQELMATIELNRFSGIVIISGDGLVFETFNGLYARTDWDEVACHIPIGIVPGGSGNALNCSLLKQLGQPLEGLKGLGATWSSKNVASGTENKSTVPLDLIEVELHNGTKMISFLGVSIGLIADVDIGSEYLRCLGYMRAYIYVAYRIMLPVTYHARISYLPLPLDSDGKPIGITSSDPQLKLPPLSEPVPSDWKVEEGNYYCLYAINLPLLDPITLFAPDSSLDDGVLWLVKIQEGMSRWEMISWLLNTQNAGHVGITGVELIPVRAFRIEPFHPIGYMGVDAESVPFGPVQGQIIGQKARLMAAS